MSEVQRTEREHFQSVGFITRHTAGYRAYSFAQGCSIGPFRSRTGALLWLFTARSFFKCRQVTP